MGKIETIHPVSNDGAEDVGQSEPYSVRVTIEGSAPMLFHAWSNEAVKEKGAAAKNSKAKKTDNVESYVRRDEAGHICLPGEYLRMSIVNAAKFRQDPRSPRKSARDLYNAGVICLTELASLGSKEWDYLDSRHAVVQRNGITRTRPAFKAGWKATIDLQVLLAEYIDRAALNSVIVDAGRLIGVGDFRPTYGRFNVTSFR
jgi:hypothetical protein